MRRQTMKFKAMRLIREFWKLACKYDGIPSDSGFVVFSNDNPYIVLQTRAQILFWKLS